MAIHLATPLLNELRLVGDCNKCGLCCVGTYQGKDVACEHLYRIALGHPEGTRCLVYEKRTDNMPILMLYENGDVAVGAECRKDCQEETLLIIQKGFGKGCSLTLA